MAIHGLWPREGRATLDYGNTHTMTKASDCGLRPALPQDLTAIMRLELAGFAPGLRERGAVFLERMAAFPEGFLLLEERGSRQCLGYICSELWDFEEAPDPARFALNHSAGRYHCSTGTELYLSSMTIDPRYRGAGLGAFLFEQCIARQIERFALRSVILIVNETWTHARHLYRRSGFSACGRIDGFFAAPKEPPQAAIVMRRMLILPGRS